VTTTARLLEGPKSHFTFPDTSRDCVSGRGVLPQVRLS